MNKDNEFDQSTTMLEIHNALNCNDIKSVADVLSRWHPVILGQMLLAVNEAYSKRCNRPHDDYLSALRYISKGVSK